jgi:hypothetical protein
MKKANLKSYVLNDSTCLMVAWARKAKKKGHGCGYKKVAQGILCNRTHFCDGTCQLRWWSHRTTDMIRPRTLTQVSTTKI